MIDPRNPLGLDQQTLEEVERDSRRIQEQEWQRQDETYLALAQLTYLIHWLKEEEAKFRGDSGDRND